MPRLPRVYIEGALYYITARSSQSQGLFGDAADYSDYVSLVARYKKQYGFKLFSYVLLPTHLHMLVELKNNVHVSQVMHDINSIYTKMSNSRYGKKGHLFQERFKAVIAEKEMNLLPLIRHIHLNPKRENPAVDLKVYPYSSHRAYLEESKRLHPDVKEEVEEVFTRLGGREDAFEKYVVGASEKELAEYKKSMKKKSVLGSKEFMELITATIGETVKRREKEETARRSAKRMQMVYAVVGGAAILFSVVTINVFSRHSSALKTRYDKTMVMYERTLKSLEAERTKVAQTAGMVENYAWKIELTEKAMAELKAEQEKSQKEKGEIEGYAWRIELNQIGGPKDSYPASDIVSIKDNRVTSGNLLGMGFSPSKYSKSELKSGETSWETIQVGKNGAMANWRGEWDGNRLRGVLRVNEGAGRVLDFSFESTGERMRVKK